MLFIDFETRSTVDLKRVGLYNYARHPTTEILCTGWAVGEGPVKVERGFPVEVQEHLRTAEQVIAHNACFEKEIAAAFEVVVPWERWVDNAALAARMSLPRKLEALAEALHLSEQKDMAGRRVMLKLSRPRAGWDKVVDDFTTPFWEPSDKPEDFEALLAYCGQDVGVMRESHRRLLALEPQEAALFALTSRMNDVGVEADIAALEPAQRVLAASSREGEERFARLTGGPGLRSYARAAAALGLPNMKKPAVRRALRDGSTPPHVKEALAIYQRLARSSPAKLEAMRLRASPDGRCRGMLVYYGAAATGRWSGAGVQPQNFPRGLGEETERAFEALEADCMDLLYEDPVGTVADMLRGFFLGPMLVGDYAQIEARMLAWRAGQLDLVKVFADHGDPYSMMASRIYGRPIDKRSTDPALPDGFTPRFLGKQVVLGCGYGMGPEKFRRMLSEIYDLDITAELAERAVATYRMSNGKILSYWTRLESAARYVLGTKKSVQVDAQTGMGLTRVGGIEYLFIHLPSGRKLYYCEPELAEDGVRYWGRNIYTGGKWERIGTYGGKLAENVTQALSRDIMADAMLRLDAAGFELWLTVHDEIVAKDNGLLPAFKEIMLTPPEWAMGLPLDVETFQAPRYRK